MLVTRQLTVAIDFYSIFFLQWKSMGGSDWRPTFFKISFCVQQEQETHTVLEQHEGEYRVSLYK